MEPQFSWDNFDRIAKTLLSLGYVMIVIGPLVGLVMMVMGDTLVRFTGIAVIAGSIFIALYHISFSLLMGALHEVIRHLPDTREDRSAA